MSEKPILQYRYPGARPFGKEERDVYYGRDKDVNNLYQLLGLKRMTVLFADSGLGKSSLINAGLIPMYEKKNSELLPVIIRFGLYCPKPDSSNEENLLVSRIIEELKNYQDLLKEKSLPFIDGENQYSIWYWLKLFERNQTPVLLVFDQFEEAFTYPENALQKLREASYPVMTGMPWDIEKDVAQKTINASRDAKPEMLAQLEKDLKFIQCPLSTHVLFVIREDKLGQLSGLSDYFPDILKNTYRLLKLSAENTREAIEKPAAQQGNFTTPSFTFTGPAIQLLLERLKEENGTYDPFTIQIACTYIERNIAEKLKKTIITETDIPDTKTFAEDFINHIWSVLESRLRTDLEKLKDTLVEELINIEDAKRKFIEERDLKIDSAGLKLLIEEGLLKEENRRGVNYIELSHDRLVRPLSDDYKKRHEYRTVKSRKREKILVLVFTLLLLTGGIFVNYNLKEEIDLLNNKLRGVITKDNKKGQVIEELIKQNRIDTFKILMDESQKNLKKKDSAAFVESISTAEQVASELKDKHLADTLMNLKKVNASYFRKVDNYSRKIKYKIDVFYDERFLPESEIIANSIIKKLRYENFVVRKRLLTEQKINSDRDYRGNKNEIRFENDAREKEIALTLEKELNNMKLVEKNNKFIRYAVGPAFKSPFYLSIFVRH